MPTDSVLLRAHSQGGLVVSCQGQGALGPVSKFTSPGGEEMALCYASPSEEVLVICKC